MSVTFTVQSRNYVVTEHSTHMLSGHWTEWQTLASFKTLEEADNDVATRSLYIQYRIAKTTVEYLTPARNAEPSTKNYQKH